MVGTWLKLALVCLSARGAACFDAGGDVPGSPGNLADAMRGAAWPASLSARPASHVLSHCALYAKLVSCVVYDLHHTEPVLTKHWY